MKGEPPVKTPRFLPPSKSRLVEPTTTPTTTSTTTSTPASVEQVKQLRIVEEIPQQRFEEPQRIQQQTILQQHQHETNIRQQLQQQRQFEQQVQHEQKAANCEPQPVKGESFFVVH